MEDTTEDLRVELKIRNGFLEEIGIFAFQPSSYLLFLSALSSKHIFARSIKRFNFYFVYYFIIGQHFFGLETRVQKLHQATFYIQNY